MKGDVTQGLMIFACSSSKNSGTVFTGGSQDGYRFSMRRKNPSVSLQGRPRGRVVFIYATLVVALDVTSDDVTADDRIGIILAAFQISANAVVSDANINVRHILAAFQISSNVAV